LIGRDFFRLDQVTKSDGSVETDFVFVGHKEMFDDKPLVDEDPRKNEQFMRDVEDFFLNNSGAQDEFNTFLEKMENPNFDEDEDLHGDFSDIDSDEDGSSDEEWNNEDFEDIFRSFHDLDGDDSMNDDESSDDESMDEMDLDRLVNEAETIEIDESDEFK
jgi:hypothetical protein